MNPARRTTATAVVLATAGGLLTAVAVPAASAATTCASPVFKRQFFANTTFSGTPKKTDCDSAIDQSWSGAPVSGLPSNNFGVRWSVTRDFGSGGPFSFTASGLDGIRVYLDPGTTGARKIDLWKNTSTTVSKTVNVTIPKGKHTLRVDYVNWTGSAKIKFGYTPRTSATVDTVKPLVPTGTSVAYDKATGKATLTWAKNKEMDLAGYRVYRRTADTWTRLSTTTATSYTDTTLPVTGATYHYEIRAHDKAGNESAGTADQPVTTVDRTAPAVPTGLDTSLSLSGIRLEWTAVAGAASYRVYRAPSGSTSYTAVGNPTTASYLDASAAEESAYTYRVSALDAAGNESARSGAVTATRPDTTAPPAVTGLTVTPTAYGFSLTWDPNPATDLGRYVVYRGELLGDDEEKVCSVHEVEWLSADTTSYEYATLPDGEEACLFVDAYDDNWWSAWKTNGDVNIVTATELDVTPSVATPEGSPLELDATAAEGDEGTHLDWNWSASAQETTGYRVYRWNPATETYEKIADLGTGATDYYDTGAQRGTTSFYWVTTLAADGTESVPAGDWAATAPTA